MSNRLEQNIKQGRPFRNLFLAVILLAFAFGATTYAAAQKITAPDVPGLRPPEGNTAFLIAHAFGSQGYTCLPADTGETSWTISPPRPEATLFFELPNRLVQIITHFTSINTHPKDFVPKPVPLSGNVTWQSSLDSSRVWAQKVKQIDAGTDQNCSNSGAIPCVLLESIGNQEGTTGGGLLARATFVQRINTKGGAAPTTTCSVGQTQLQPYSADYVFFRGEE